MVRGEDEVKFGILWVLTLLKALDQKSLKGEQEWGKKKHEILSNI